MINGFGADANSYSLNVVNSGGASALAVRDDGRVGIGTTTPGAKFMVKGDGMTNSTVAMNIVNANSTSLFHIKDDGKVGIGTTAPTEALTVNGNVVAQAYMMPSDRRYKTNIATLSNSLAVIGQLRGTSYLLKDPAQSQDLQIGFIAQELEEVLPSLVHTDANGYKSVNYVAVVPLLTEAVKEQQQTIESQQARIEKLEAEMTEIREMLKK